MADSVNALSETRVFFFGASIVAAETCYFARRLGFQCIVLDCDETQFAREGFETCDTRLVDFDEIPDLGITEDDMVCVVTRGHKYDPQSLVYALNTPAFYIGMLPLLCSF